MLKTKIKKRLSFLLIFVMLMSSNPVFVIGEQNNVEQVVAEDNKETITENLEPNQLIETDELTLEKNDNANLTSINQNVKSDAGKYIVTNDIDGSEVGRYELFQEATAAINLPNVQPGAYTITLTEDDLDMGIWGGISYGYQVTLKSGEGGPYKIVCKRESDTNTAWHISQVAGDLILENIILDGNNKGGGIAVSSINSENPSSLTLKNGAVIQNCYDTINPGTIRTIGENITITMEKGSSIISNHVGTNGGGVAVTGGNTFIMNGGVISNNKTDKVGGGVQVNDGGHFIMNGGKIIGNSADSYGGGICISGESTIEINGGIISGNSAFHGGGVYIDNRNGNFNFKNVVIEDNKATSSGGGISSYSQLKITDSVIKNNKASTTGGGIAAWAPIDITNSKLHGNESQEGGGVWIRHYYNPEGISSIKRSELKENTAKWGGGIELSAGTLTLENSKIINNKTISSGGGIFTNGAIDIIDSTIGNNYAATVGGGIDARASILTITSTNIEENESVQGGGGLFLRSDATDMESIVKDSIIKNNNADIGGGVVLMNKASLVSEGTEIIENVAVTEGGGIYTDDAEYENPIASTSYQKIKANSSTVFKDNIAGDGLYNPPSNALDFTNIGFTQTSVTGKNLISPDHPFNNYDINYKFENPIEIFKIIYDANGGTGSFTEEISLNVDYTIKSNTEVGISKEGYTFKGWNTKADGSGTSYKAGDKFKITANTALYAQWQKYSEDSGTGWTWSGGSSTTSKESPKTEEVLTHMAYLNGYPDNTIRSQGSITRAEVAAIFARLKVGEANIPSAKANYSDVNSSDWYAKYIAFVTDNKIMESYEDGSFKPNDKITRAEFTAVVARYNSLTDTTSTFEDVIGHWAAGYIGSVTNKGWINGYPDGTFKPEKDISREEVATMVNKMLDRKVDRDGLNNLSIKNFTDLDNSGWSYFDIVEASNSHKYVRRTLGDIMENWKELIK
ncbi:Listeria/Bacterioides repeat-containing protein [Anaerosphaera aminiphila DSM 21120]|uniref:Listeria/Bacterioides repeat-containing protein n=1 Tax=Anaerosphaera aminiphila DSM 21120 TaxID=1120995 RepID=A0A1M5UG47_9FIRM|nr:S-layer homology domain-containing protein [Anaerosphaera aminiphila]SHH61888.1 Listeria/Bacterioides repeat-containing protein [Anaerosphaera aminiphila DSM 21120]